MCTCVHFIYMYIYEIWLDNHQGHYRRINIRLYELRGVIFANIYISLSGWSRRGKCRKKEKESRDQKKKQ